MRTVREMVLAVYAKGNGDWDKIYYIFKNKIQLSEDEIDRLLATLGNLNDYIAITDADYPEECKRMHKPPFAIRRENKA